jgi:hypothetical protein
MPAIMPRKQMLDRPSLMLYVWAKMKGYLVDVLVSNSRLEEGKTYPSRNVNKIMYTIAR